MTTLHMIPAPLDFKANEQDDSLVVVGEGEYFVGDQNLWMGKNAILQGAGRNTRLVNFGYRVSARGCAWQLNDGVIIRDIVLECRTTKGQQNQVVGVQHNYSPPPVEVSGADFILDNVGIVGHTFGVYSWGGIQNKFNIYRSDIEAGKWGLGLGGGSGPDAQYAYVYDTRIIIDYDRLPSAGGDQGDVACGVVIRGGECNYYGGKISVLGSKDATLAAGVYSSSIPGPPWAYKWPNSKFFGTVFDVRPNGAKDSYDILAEVGEVIAYGCTRADGKPLKVSGNVIVV